MEQKKLLLVILSVGVFLVVVIGLGMIVFAPDSTQTRGSQPILAQHTPSAVASPVPTTIDAREWAKNPSSVAELREAPQPLNNSNSNVVYIYGERPSSTDGATQIVTEQSPDGTVIIDVNRPAQPATSQAVPGASSPTAINGTASVAAAEPARTAPAATTRPAPAATARPAPVATARPAAATSRPAPVASRKPEPKLVDEYWIQAGSFATRSGANTASQKLKERGLTSVIQTSTQGDTTWFRVRLGPWQTRSEADYWMGLLTSIDGFGSSMVYHNKVYK